MARTARIRTSLLAAAALAALCAWRLAPQSFEGVEVRSQPVAGAVHALTGAGGTVAATFGEDGLVLVDAQFAELAGRLRAALDALDGDGGGAPRWLINTHHHGDHTSGNAALAGGATIVAHENVRARLLDGPQPTAPEGLPRVCFASGVTLHLNGEELRVVHYPAAHTDGDSVVFFEGSRVVHMGDLFFHGVFPFVDQDAGGSVAGVRAGVADVLAHIDDDWKVIAGHGRSLGTRADLAAYAEFLERSVELVREALAAGDDVAAMLANGLLDEYQSMSWTFIPTERWLQTLVRELSAR